MHDTSEIVTKLRNRHSEGSTNLRMAVVDTVDARAGKVTAKIGTDTTASPMSYLGWYNPIVGDTVWILDAEPVKIILGPIHLHGAVNTTDGMYVHAAFFLESKGWTSANFHSAPESDWPVGLSFLQTNNLSGAVWPGNGYVFIQSFCGMGVRSFQIAIDTVGARFYRHWSSSGWQPWQRISAGLWAAVAFQNGWVNYGGSHATAAYTAESGNTVRLKGLVKSGAIGTIFSVDSERAPSEIHIYNCMSNTGQARVDVNPNGSVVLVGYYNGGSNGWVSLAGITWRYG